MQLHVNSCGTQGSPGRKPVLVLVLENKKKYRLVLEHVPVAVLLFFFLFFKIIYFNSTEFKKYF